MKIAYAPYELRAKKGGLVRKGALFQVEVDGTRGFADCHPWEEHGDLPLKEQLALLSKGEFTRQTEQSIKFAKIDAKARSEGVSLFQNVQIPSSHYLLTDLEEEIPQDFSLVKLKLGYDVTEEISRLPKFLKQLPEGSKVRFDFNNRIDHQIFKRYLPILEQWRSKIDFIEDPFPFNESLWETVQRSSGLKLALDRDSELHTDAKFSHSVTIVKPAIQEAAWVCSNVSQQVVITSYLDHPLGQAAAAYSALLIAQTYPEKLLACGLLSHTFYQTNKYSERFFIDHERLVVPVTGAGFGFDDLLEEESWQPL